MWEHDTISVWFQFWAQLRFCEAMRKSLNSFNTAIGHRFECFSFALNNACGMQKNIKVWLIQKLTQYRSMPSEYKHFFRVLGFINPCLLTIFHRYIQPSPHSRAFLTFILQWENIIAYIPHLKHSLQWVTIVSKGCCRETLSQSQFI